ncbi:leucine-rich repeat-containing protein 70-like [Lineus longissimus]|uniref:leucine-rich repeat-containing protein 70-like n=1 Tax=Lineus longissimus TaxID=88925 RepID=UPI00315DFCC4
MARMGLHVCATLACVFAGFGLISCCTFASPTLLCLDIDYNNMSYIQSLIDLNAPEEFYAYGATNMGNTIISFGQRENLNSITLADCDIDSFQDSDIFKVLPGLRFLNLTINGLTAIPHLPKSLQWIDLSGNDLLFSVANWDDTSAVKAFFSPLEGLELLQDLDLSHNDLGFFGGFSISNKLKFLDLSYNPLYKIWLQNTPWILNLTYTNIEMNAKSTRIDNFVFHPRGQLKRIDFNNAGIDRIDTNFLETLTAWSAQCNLQISWQYNPWVCDCHSVQLRAWMVALSRTSIIPDWFQDGITCNSPAKVAGNTLVSVAESDLVSVGGTNCPV